MGKLNYAKRNKFNNGYISLSDEANFKSRGERWLEVLEASLTKKSKKSKINKQKIA